MRDRSGRIIREERAGGRWTEYEYDQRGRLTRSSFSDGTIEAFSYDALGRLTEARNTTGSVSMEYDEGGRVVKECFSGGLPGDKGTTVENIYDDLGNRIETRTSLGSVVQNSFDEDGLLSRVTASGGGGENWEEKIIRDSEGLKIEKIFSGGIHMTRTYDAYGNVISQKSRSFRQDGYDRRYAWNASGRLQSVIDGITGGRTTYAYDAVGSLMSARYEDGTDDYRMPDAAGNVFRSRDRRDREYGKGGRILHDRHYDYLYDVEGNLILKTPRRGLTPHPNHEVSEESGTHIVWQTGDYAYEWYGNGMLKEVRLPYGKTVRFEYDALGRRTAKLFNGHVFRYLWDGNVMVQEWQYEEKDRPQHSIDEFGRIRMQGEEPVENLVTWVYEEGSYVPVAKIQNGERYTIISDYMGRPVEAYNSYGNVVWQADYDIYGDLRNIKGIRDFIPFRQLGQYEDDETRLYYNRFRYYDPRIGNYISQDPIRLMGNNPTLYGYVGDLNNWVDIFGLKCKSPNGYKTGDVDIHGNLSPQSNRAHGHTNTRADGFVQSHHPIQDLWAQKNINGYNRNDAPATLLKSASGEPHAKISSSQRTRRLGPGGWNTTLKQEFNISYKEMIDAGVAPEQAKKVIKDSYKYFDSLRGQNIGNPFFDI